MQTIESLNDIEVVYANGPEEQHDEDNFVEEETSNDISSPHKSNAAAPVFKLKKKKTCKTKSLLAQQYEKSVVSNKDGLMAITSTLNNIAVAIDSGLKKLQTKSVEDYR